MLSTSRSRSKHAKLPLIAASSLAGTAMEWYDFFLYATASALVFNRLFFPADDPLVGTMLAFGTYAVGFVARPVGAAVLGHYGDRNGRRSVLVASLVLMGTSTCLIAVIPSYQSIGVVAPILLIACRLVQGFALGGEWGGAVLLVAEHVDDGARRAFWSSWPNVGPPLGNLMAAGVMAALGVALPEDQFLSWGWRVAFALSAVLVAVGLWLRLRVAETPMFEEASRTRTAPERAPTLTVFRRHWRQVLVAMGARFGENAGYYLYCLFVITYVTEMLGLVPGVALAGVMVGQVVAVVMTPLLAALSDRTGRRPILLAASVATMVWAFAFFGLLDTRSAPAIAFAIAVGCLVFSAFNAVMGAFFSELFPTSVRYSGASISYNLASVFAGSLAPIIAIALYRQFQTGIAIAVYLCVMGGISLVATLLVRETRTVDLRSVHQRSSPPDRG